MAYKESDPFYHTKAWKRLRKDALDRDKHMCQECMRRFEMGLIRKPRRAQMVHHLIPRTERPDLEMHLDNLQSLCWACHNEMHPEKGGRPLDKEKKPAHSMRVMKV